MRRILSTKYRYILADPVSDIKFCNINICKRSFSSLFFENFFTVLFYCFYEIFLSIFTIYRKCSACIAYHVFNVKDKFSDSSFLGIPLEITGLLIFPLFVTIKVISKYPLTDKFFLFIDNESELTAILPSKIFFQ